MVYATAFGHCLAPPDNIFLIIILKKAAIAQLVPDCFLIIKQTTNR